MFDLLLGVLLLAASIGGLWFSRAVGGQVRPFARNGRDTYIAVAVTVGVGFGIAALVSGVVELMY
jgi:hypothetical protein